MVMGMLESEIRRHVFDAFRQNLVCSQGDIHTYVTTRTPPPYQLTKSEEEAYRRVMWELAKQGVIEPGPQESRELLQCAQLTEYGKACVLRGEELPHDPEGFLKSFHDAMGGEVDKLSTQYLAEALECFHRGSLRAAAVMLGVAAERSLDCLRAAYTAGLSADSRAKAEKKLNSRHLRDRFEYLWQRVRELDLPADLRDRLEGNFWGTFQLIRRSRNDAGHFTTIEIDKATALACLASFPGFVRTLRELIPHLGSQSGK